MSVTTKPTIIGNAILIHFCQTLYFFNVLDLKIEVAKKIQPKMNS